MAIEIPWKSDKQFDKALPGSTICELICIQLQRIYLEQSHEMHEEEIVRLANILLPNTKTYGIYILAIYRAIEDLNYGLALQAGRLMLQHETMLHAIVEGHPIQIGTVMN